MPLSRSTSSFFDRLFWRPAIRFLVPLSRSAASYSDRLFWRPAIRFPVPLSLSASPFLTGYFDARLSGFSFLSPAPPRLILTGYFDARLSGFRCPSPAPQRLLLTGYFTARISGFRCPISRSASSFSGRLFWRPGLPFPVPQGLLFAPRFGILDHLFRRPPFSHPTLPSQLFGWPARSLCRLTVGLRFLPPRGFYRSAFFTAPRFFTAPLSPVPWGGLCSSAALVLAVPQSSPTSGRLALWATLRYACEFYRSAIFYRSTVFTAPRFLPLRGFYRSAVFSAPRFFPLRFRRFFGGLCSSFLPSSLRPLPGAPCATGSSVASPGGHRSWSYFWTTCLTALGALPLISPVSLLYLSYTLGDHRSSRLLTDGTRAPRVLPPPSWDLSAIGN